MRDPAKLISLRPSPLGRDWERGRLSPYGWIIRHFRSCKLCLTMDSKETVG